MTIDKTKKRKKSADIVVHIVQGDATNIDKNTIEDFVIRLVAQKVVIKKNTPQGNESYHKTSTDEYLTQPPRYSIRTHTTENLIKYQKWNPGPRPRQTSLIRISTLEMMFLMLFTKITWIIKGMLMTFLTH